MSSDSTSAIEKRGSERKKLAKVLSTKLSIDDYNVFRILTNQAYRSGAIREDGPSEMLRYMITPVVDEIDVKGPSESHNTSWTRKLGDPNF